MKTAAVIPAFNEAATIGPVWEQTFPHVDLIIVIDDGSDDGTSLARGDMIRHSRNQGKGAALRTGIQSAIRAGADIIVTLDSDGQHDPAEIPRLISAMEKADLVLGKRTRTRSMPGIRRWSNGFSSLLVSLAMGKRFYDVHSGFRAYRANLFREMEIHSRRYEVEIELLLKAGRAGRRVVQVPVSTRYGSERSKFSAVRDTVRFLKAVAIFSLGLDQWTFRSNARRWWKASLSVVESAIGGFWRRFVRFRGTGLSRQTWPAAPTRTDLSP